MRATCNARSLAVALAAADPHRSSDVDRPTLCGWHILFTPGRITVTTSDSHRLAKVTVADELVTETTSFVLAGARRKLSTFEFVGDRKVVDHKLVLDVRDDGRAVDVTTSDGGQAVWELDPTMYPVTETLWPRETDRAFEGPVGMNPSYLGDNATGWKQACRVAGLKVPRTLAPCVELVSCRPLKPSMWKDCSGGQRYGSPVRPYDAEYLIMPVRLD